MLDVASGERLLSYMVKLLWKAAILDLASMNLFIYIIKTIQKKTNVFG